MSDASRTSSGSQPFSAPQRPSSPADSPLAEPLFPQISLRSLFALMVFAAAVLWTLRVAWVGGELWAQCAVVVMGTVAGSFIVYALLFLLALAIAQLAVPALREAPPKGAEAKPPPGTEQLRKDG